MILLPLMTAMVAEGQSSQKMDSSGFALTDSIHMLQLQDRL
jgi:hypothetical protein